MDEQDKRVSEQQRRNAVRTALVLAAVAVAVYVGYVIARWWRAG